jgi:hypothetical protein
MRRSSWAVGLVVSMNLCVSWSGTGAAETNHRRANGTDRATTDGERVFLTDVPDYGGNVILGRPSDRSITLSVLLHEAARVRVAYGRSGRSLGSRTPPIDLEAGEPREIALDGLEPDAAYQYRIVNAGTGTPLLPVDVIGAFHTCRRPGSPFTFTVQADSHLDGSCLPDLYRLSLASALADGPDFHVDLGDTFMTDQHADRASAARQYAAQRYYFGLIGHSAPVFLVLGNHDGEETSKRGATDADGLAVWSSLQRKRLFPNPVPDRFYAGNSDEHPNAGQLQDYYAWQWGDALLLVLDPYWYSPATRGGTEPWNSTIGKTQYDWLAKTLRASRSKFKFVFIHQLTGGLDAGGRGGAEAALLYEWGGHEKDGEDTFVVHRPGWDRPIHQLLVDSGVTIVFHGHDHFFARQELDGVVYQLVPQPAHRSFRRNPANEYGYQAGDFFPNSGYLRVHVAPAAVAVDYVRAATADMERRGLQNGTIAFQYTCVPK